MHSERRARITDTIIREVAALTGSTAALGNDTSLFNDVLLDSAAFIELMLRLEDGVPGFTFAPEQMGREQYATIGALAGFIDGAVGGGS